MEAKQKGFIFGLFKTESMIIKMLIIVVIAVLIVPSIMFVFPIARYVIAILIAFFLFELVAKALGNNIFTYLISLVLIYFLVWKYLFLSASLMMMYLFLGAGFFSVLIWGTARFSNK